MTSFIPAIPLSPFSRTSSICSRFRQAPCYSVLQSHRRLFTLIRPLILAISASPSPGNLVFIQTSSSRRLARILRPDGKRNWYVTTHDATLISITPKQILFNLKDYDPAQGDIDAYLATCMARASEDAELLQIAWELVSAGDGIDGGITATLEHIAQLMYDDDSPHYLFLTHLMLSDYNIYFKQRLLRGCMMYEAKTEQLVEAARLQLEREEQQQKEEQKRDQAVIQAVENGDLSAFTTLLQPHGSALIEDLKTMALELQFGNAECRTFAALPKNNQPRVRHLMALLNKQLLPLAAFEVLVSLNIFTRHQNLPLYKYAQSFQKEFSEGVQQEAALLTPSVPDLDVSRRVNHCSIPSYAIDSADTTEVDDAISYDSTTGRVLVHIADPTRYFPPGYGELILEEALRRTATLYMPTDKYTMFPKALAETLFSLDANDENCALTFSFLIRDDGVLDEESFEIHPSIIKRPARLTYEQADILISTNTDESQDLRALHKLAVMRRNWREIEGGAIFVKSDFPIILVENETATEPSITVGATSCDSPSWVLVPEMMVAACIVGATIGKNGNIHLPYRCQEAFDYPPDEVIEAIPDGPARAAVIFKEASASQVRPTPDEHASLGVDAYAQVTSPIRRSADLLTHFQLKAFLRGDMLPYSMGDITKEIARIGDVGKMIRHVEARSNRYWQLEYLRRNEGKVYKGMFVKLMKENVKRGFVYLDDICMQITASVTPGLKLGQQVSVKVRRVDPRLNLVDAFCITESEKSMQEMQELEMELADLFSDVSSESDVGA